jgi:hypothetical protein
MITCFSPETIKPINCYVYALVDPAISTSDPSRYFYIGKGQGDRCFDHAREELATSEFEQGLKLNRIREIRERTGKSPEVIIVAHGLDREQALRLEALLIAVIPGLTNEVYGRRHADYWLRAIELDARYSDPLPASQLQSNVLLVSLNGDPKKNLPAFPLIENDPETVSERTLGNWVIGVDRARSVDFVVGVYAGLMRCVFEIEHRNGSNVFEVLPPEAPGKMRRIRFAGVRAPEKEAIWAMRRLVNDTGTSEVLTKFPPQSATRFVPKQ